MEVQGLVNPVHGETISGWLINKEDKNWQGSVDIFVNGQFYKKIDAHNFRKDLVSLEKHSSGNCGFSFNSAGINLENNAVNDIRIKASNNEQELINSPLVIDKRSFKNRILIVGINKSGTSILTYRVAAGLKTRKIYFEPKGKDGLADFRPHEKLTSQNNMVTKCLYHYSDSPQLNQVAALYDKKIWIIRDPRDVVISSFFYTWYKKHNNPTERFNLAYERVIAKEADPESISFFDLIKNIFNLSYIIKSKYSVLARHYQNLSPDWFKLKYEDFLKGDHQDLNNYLGFDLDRHAEVNKRVSRVKRSSAFGDWRNWFTASDLPEMKRLFNPILEAIGYDIDDWKLNDNVFLDPSKGSDYMFKLHHG